MRERFDVVVVGAGPGGLVAAVTAGQAGMRVCLVDDNPSCGGQIWRASITEHGGPSAQWLDRMPRAHVEIHLGARAVFAPAAGVLRIEQSGQFTDLEYGSLILATGARELFLPFPGWTLPGVYGAGGLQAFVKSGLNIRGKRVVIAGTGPLLLAVGAHLRAAGARIVAMVEQAPMSRLARFSLGLVRGQIGKLFEGAAYALNTAGIPYRTGAWVTSALGQERLEKVTIRSRPGILEVATDMLAIGYHLVPNTELAQLLQCELDGGYVRVDELQQTSVKGIYCAGELTGIGGVDKAKLEGRIAALAAAGQADKAIALLKKRDRHVRFARNLAAAFALRDELRILPADATLVCRCEDVSYGALSQCRSWREAKLHTRCGMGPCQGRICGASTEFLFGWHAPAPRPPVFPVEVQILGSNPEAAHGALGAPSWLCRGGRPQVPGVHDVV
jgi:NADPH-dependent 2,4-dienoyl-CoA reductase/sulfur reductase-like enzyme